VYQVDEVLQLVQMEDPEEETELIIMVNSAEVFFWQCETDDVIAERPYSKGNTG